MKTKTLKLNKEQTIDYIVARVQAKFRTFGGGVVVQGNPLAAALRDAPPQFAAGVEIRGVVKLIIEELE
jgi:hypothetical protein